MIRLALPFFFFFSTPFVAGCLTVPQTEYTIKLTSAASGVATIRFIDIASTPETPNRTNLPEHYPKWKGRPDDTAGGQEL